jgi:alkylation response protein AidB-like acyl-CoA dehydrogenase
MAARTPLFQGSLAIAEASRDTKRYSGFLSGLFEGIVRSHLFDSYGIPPISEATKEFLERLRPLLIEKVDPDTIDREGEVGEDIVAALKQIGAFGLKIPKTYGGLGLSQSDYHRVATFLGSHDAALTVLISAHNSIGAAEPVKLVGDQEQQQRWLPRLAAGEISGFALTERDAGCDIWDLKTYAIPVREHGDLVGYRLTGEKVYTTNAPRRDGKFLASLLVVIAQIVDEPHEVARPKEQRRFGAFVVETHASGCRCSRFRFMGVRGIYNGRVQLRDVFVPRSDRLGQEGEGLRRALETLTVGRLTLPAACLGSLKQCLWLARRRAQQRIQYDRPIGEHTDIGSKLVRMAARTLALEAVVTITGVWADAKMDVRLESAAAKILASEWLLESLLDLFRIYGGRGFETTDSLRLRGEIPAPVERMIRDSLINVIWEGTNGILTLWIGREGLAEYVARGNAFLEFQITEMARVLPFFTQVAARSLRVASVHERKPSRSNPSTIEWERFLAQKSRELARKTLWVTARHRQGLARKQRLLTGLVTAGMQLFAGEALAWYVSQPEIHGQRLCQSLAEDFWVQVKELFDPTPLLSLRTPRWDDDRRLFHLAKDILAGQTEWLEAGILPSGSVEHGLVDQAWTVGAENLMGLSSKG